MRRILAALAMLTLVAGCALSMDITNPDGSKVHVECPPFPTRITAPTTGACTWTGTPPTTTGTATTTPTSSSTTTTTTSAPSTTTTPPPAVLRGWQLTTSNAGLAPHGLTCSGLRPYDGLAKPQRGARISNVRIAVPLDLSAGDIVIEKSCIQPAYTGDRNLYLITNMVCPGDCTTRPESGGIFIRDSEISGAALPAQAVARSCAFDGVATLQRNLIHSTGTGICFRATGDVHSALAEHNYVRALRHFVEPDAAHHSAATVRDFVPSPGRSVRFINNRLDATIGTHVTAALFIQPTYRCCPIVNLRAEGNLFEGETYNLVLEQSAGGYRDVHAVNNRFAPTERGSYGPTSRTGGEGWKTWEENRLHHTTERYGAEGKLIPAP